MNKLDERKALYKKILLLWEYLPACLRMLSATSFFLLLLPTFSLIEIKNGQKMGP